MKTNFKKKFMACWKINQYIGHLFKLHPTYIAIKWTPIGNRKGQKPKDTWRRSGQEERKENDWTW